jgi:formyltetrahydrofolate-dependent phosphoribosylglycinamide formyltransferase
MASKNIEFDVVVPTPSSGSLAGEGLAERSGKRLVHGVGTSHYVGRTFIMPGQENRKDAVSNKHIIIPDELDGMSVADEDDSTVRGTTSGKITEQLRKGGAKEVHKALAAPPVVDTCDLGVDMHDRSELPAAKVADKSHAEKENYMAHVMHSDTATFLTREDISKAFNRNEKDMCTFCLGGEHPIHGQQETFPQRERQTVGRPKLSVFISGNGTNLQEIINRTQKGSLDAEIVSVVSNNSKAYGLRRAMEAQLPIFPISSEGRLSTPLKQIEYEERLLDVIYSNLPDVVVLAGYMKILGDSFLEAMQDLEIPVLNLHPALLTADNREKIATSQGKMPVLRGSSAIDQAFSQNLRTSGVTVHQVLPGNECDTGPIVLKEEVHRRIDDTLEDWENRIHQTEHRVLPTAISRVLHVMKHGIDVSKGEFPWH